MTPQQSYTGPTSLGFSRYASPNLRRAQPAPIPPSVSASTIAPPENSIATKEQIAASYDRSANEDANQSSGTQLAVAQGKTLKEEVDKHTAHVSNAVSRSVVTTRQFLQVIREAVQKEDASALDALDHLWVELEQLFEVVKGSKDALPGFLEKQRNSMALYHTSVVNDTYRESQEELNVQHKKVNLQHSLILEQQQAFQEYKAQTAAKLKILEELQERVSRLTLEKGHFRGEIDKYARLLEQEKSSKYEDTKRTQALRGELDTVVASKKQLLTEVDGFQKALSSLQEKMQAAEQEMTNRFATQLKEKTDLLSKASAANMTLTTTINALKASENNTRLQLEKLGTETKGLDQKYKGMVAQHAKVFANNKEQIGKIEKMTGELERFRQESNDMKERLAKLPELKRTISALEKEKAELSGRIEKLASELNAAKEETAAAKKQIANIAAKLEKAQNDNENLEADNKNLLSKQTELIAKDNDTTHGSETATSLKSENAKLKMMINELRAKRATAVSSNSAGVDENKLVLDEKIQGLEKELKETQEALDSWTELAKKSYKEYKDIVPLSKQAEQLRKEVDEKDKHINNLKDELSSAKKGQSNGVSGGDAAYWKGKYENLLANLGN